MYTSETLKQSISMLAIAINSAREGLIQRGETDFLYRFEYYDEILDKQETLLKKLEELGVTSSDLPSLEETEIFIKINALSELIKEDAHDLIQEIKGPIEAKDAKKPEAIN